MNWFDRIFRSRPALRLDIASCCECGPVRYENQDSILVDRRNRVFAVADGMGGADGGAEASAAVVKEIAGKLGLRPSLPMLVRRVDEAVAAANCKILDFSRRAGYSGMGSTLTLLAVGRAGSAIVGNIGDSRVYRYRSGEFAPLTRDHSLVNDFTAESGDTEAAVVRKLFSNVITRAVGMSDDAAVEWNRIDVQQGDAFLVCSDGVHGYVGIDSIRGAFAAGGRAKDICAKLSRRVLGAGAPDNYSIIVVKVK